MNFKILLIAFFSLLLISLASAAANKQYVVCDDASVVNNVFICTINNTAGIFLDSTSFDNHWQQVKARADFPQLTEVKWVLNNVDLDVRGDFKRSDSSILIPWNVETTNSRIYCSIGVTQSQCDFLLPGTLTLRGARSDPGSSFGPYGSLHRFEKIVIDKDLIMRDSAAIDYLKWLGIGSPEIIVKGNLDMEKSKIHFYQSGPITVQGNASITGVQDSYRDNRFSIDGAYILNVSGNATLTNAVFGNMNYSKIVNASPKEGIHVNGVLTSTGSTIGFVSGGEGVFQVGSANISSSNFDRTFKDFNVVGDLTLNSGLFTNVSSSGPVLIGGNFSATSSNVLGLTTNLDVSGNLSFNSSGLSFTTPKPVFVRGATGLSLLNISTINSPETVNVLAGALLIGEASPSYQPAYQPSSGILNIKGGPVIVEKDIKVFNALLSGDASSGIDFIKSKSGEIVFDNSNAGTFNSPMILNLGGNATENFEITATAPGKGISFKGQGPSNNWLITSLKPLRLATNGELKFEGGKFGDKGFYELSMPDFDKTTAGNQAAKPSNITLNSAVLRGVRKLSTSGNLIVNSSMIYDMHFETIPDSEFIVLGKTSLVDSTLKFSNPIAIKVEGTDGLNVTGVFLGEEDNGAINGAGDINVSIGSLTVKDSKRGLRNLKGAITVAQNITVSNSRIDGDNSTGITGITALNGNISVHNASPPAFWNDSENLGQVRTVKGAITASNGSIAFTGNNLATVFFGDASLIPSITAKSIVFTNLATSEITSPEATFKIESTAGDISLNKISFTGVNGRIDELKSSNNIYLSDSTIQFMNNASTNFTDLNGVISLDNSTIQNFGPAELKFKKLELKNESSINPNVSDSGNEIKNISGEVLELTNSWISRINGRINLKDHLYLKNSQLVLIGATNTQRQIIINRGLPKTSNPNNAIQSIYIEGTKNANNLNRSISSLNDTPSIYISNDDPQYPSIIKSAYFDAKATNSQPIEIWSCKFDARDGLQVEGKSITLHTQSQVSGVTEAFQGAIDQGAVPIVDQHPDCPYGGGIPLTASSLNTVIPLNGFIVDKTVTPNKPLDNGSFDAEVIDLDSSKGEEGCKTTGKEINNGQINYAIGGPGTGETCKLVPGASHKIKVSIKKGSITESIQIQFTS